VKLSDEAYEEVIGRLAARRKMLDMTQAEVVEAMNVPMSATSSFSLWERRKTRPSPANLVRWATALRMELQFGVYLNCKEYAEPYVALITPQVDDDDF
jgi:transcriptional regulator with XRE-family HTH domain